MGDTKGPRNRRTKFRNNLKSEWEPHLVSVADLYRDEKMIVDLFLGPRKIELFHLHSLRTLKRRHQHASESDTRGTPS